MKRALLFKSTASYWPQAQLAINSARYWNPDYDIHIVTDSISAPGIYHHVGRGEKWLATGQPETLIEMLEAGYDQVVFLDSDTYTYGPFLEVEEELGAGASMLVTPHITAPLPLTDDLEPSIEQIARMGNYNAGFVAVTPAALPFLRFWLEATRKFCYLDASRYVSGEQTGLRFACDFDEHAKVFRHPGYNWAYWNACQRPLSCTATGELLAAGLPLRVAHFSGLTPDLSVAKMSRYQNRDRLAPESLEYTVFAAYQSQLRACLSL